MDQATAINKIREALKRNQPKIRSLPNGLEYKKGTQRIELKKTGTTKVTTTKFR